MFLVTSLIKHVRHLNPVGLTMNITFLLKKFCFSFKCEVVLFVTVGSVKPTQSTTSPTVSTESDIFDQNDINQLTSF